MSLEEPSALPILGFISIIISLTLLIFVFYAVKKKQYKVHKWLMLAAAVSNTLFLVFYVTRYIKEGNTSFTGSDWIFRYLYLPILIIHIGAAVVSIYFVECQLYLGGFKAKIDRLNESSLYLVFLIYWWNYYFYFAVYGLGKKNEITYY